MTHFNTTNERAEKLRRYIYTSDSQERSILDFFKSRFQHRWSPSEIQTIVLPNAPITSVRRAITVLTQAGYLEKTDMKCRGQYGRPEYMWRLSSFERTQVKIRQQMSERINRQRNMNMDPPAGLPTERGHLPGGVAVVYPEDE